jgi:hypothetical protein
MTNSSNSNTRATQAQTLQIVLASNPQPLAIKTLFRKKCLVLAAHVVEFGSAARQLAIGLAASAQAMQ